MNSESTVECVRQTVAAIFNVPLEQVDLETSAMSIENWDSMGHLMLILEIEQQFEIQLQPEQVECMTSVSEIARILDDMQVAGSRY